MADASGDDGALRERLVDELVRDGAVTTVAVEAALRAVPRHLFVPGVDLELAYANQAIPTKVEDGVPVSSASQPSIVAIMLEQLAVRAGDRVLEIGAGTGYNAALLARLAAPGGRVVAVDIDDDIVDAARLHLEAAGVEDVEVVCGDGALGHLAGAPYDRVVATVGIWDIPPAWWEQLAPRGRLVAPISLGGGVQRSVALEQRGGRLESVSVRDCGFMRLRGPFAGAETMVAAGPVRLVFDAEVDEAAVQAALDRPAEERVLDVEAAPSEVFGGLALWLALHNPGAGTAQAMWAE